MAKMKVAPSEQTGRLGNRRAGNPATACRHVRIRVQACGICYSDHLTKDNLWPGLQYPRVPGHEVAGVIDEAGAGKACRVHSGYARRKAATSSLRLTSLALGSGMDGPDYDDRHLHQVDKRCGRSYIISSQ